MRSFYDAGKPQKIVLWHPDVERDADANVAADDDDDDDDDDDHAADASQ